MNQSAKLWNARFRGFVTIVMVCVLQLYAPDSSYGQTKVVADKAISITSGNNRYSLCLLVPCSFNTTVKDVENAQLDNEQFATLYASPGLLAGLLSYKGGVELTFPEEIAANQWSYIRIGADNSLLGSLLGGSLGQEIGTILSAVLLGNQEIEVQALYNDDSRLKRTNTQGFDTDRVRVVKDKMGNYYIAVKPGGTYNKIRITNQSSSIAGLFQEYALRVYSAVTYKGTSSDCGSPFFTSFDGGNGLGLKAVDLDNQKLERAVDDDVNTYSELKSSGVLNLAVSRSLSQFFYFNTSSLANHTFNIKLGLASGGLANLDLLGALQVLAWNGDQVVYTRSLAGGVLNGVNVLELFNNPQAAATLAFAPGQSFDRVEVRLNSVVGLDLIGNGVRIYDVKRYSGHPTCINTSIIQPEERPRMLSQYNCASQLISSSNADFATNITDGKNDTYATLSAHSGVALGVGAYSSHVEMGFSTPVSEGTTTYIRIDFDRNQLGKLLDGSVGELLGNAVDDLLFGNHYFVVEAKRGNTVILSRSSATRFATSGADAVGEGNVKIVQDKYGNYYIALRTPHSFSSIRISERLSALVGAGASATMKVYHGCYSTGSLDCEQSYTTYSQSLGIGLDLLGLGKAGVTHAYKAMDANITTASEVSIGALGVGATMLQQFQFHGLSSDRDHFRVKMKMTPQGTVTADVVGSIIVKAYSGDMEVYSQRLNERLLPNLDLLSLLSNGSMLNIPIAPGKVFDRVAVGISSLVGANVLINPLEIFSVERFSISCPDLELSWENKTEAPFTNKDCGTSVTSFDHVNFPFEAITDAPSGDTYATLSAGAGLVGGLGAYSSHLELKYAQPIAANEVSYIRVDGESNLFNALLGGALGTSLANALGTVALGHQYINVKIKDVLGNQIGATYSSQAGWNSESVRLVKDAYGRFYLAITSPYDYQSIRIEYHHTALVGAMGSSSIKVYSMCREKDVDLCEQATFTSWDGTGISLDIADLTKGGVSDPQYAIDGVSANYSTLSVGLAGAGASISQSIYFKSKSQATDLLRLRMQLQNPGVLNIDLLGQSRLKLYNGQNLVYDQPLTAGLINNLDLLGLFNTGGVQSLTFAPNVSYDRVKLEILSTVGLNVNAPIRFYGIKRITPGCPDPDFVAPPYRSSVCADVVETGGSYTGGTYHTYAVDDLENAIDGNHNSYASIRSGAGVILGVHNVSGKMTLGYNANVPANRISYIHISEDKGLLNALLSGSIGHMVGGVVNTIALGNHYFTVDVQDANGNNLVSGNSKSAFATADNKIKIVQDKSGRYYIALSANTPYRKVVIKTFTESVVGVTAQDNALNVYGMCYESDFEGCAEGVTTSWDGSGISLGVTGLADYGVVDPYRALDNNNSADYSMLSLGAMNVTGYVQQNIQFNKSIVANSVLKIRMSVGQGQLDAAIFGRMGIVAYRDGIEVYNQDLQSAVIGQVNLLQLFNNGAIHEIAISPQVAFDEVALRLTSLAGVSLIVPNVRLYSVKLDCEAPTFIAWKSFKDATTGLVPSEVVGNEEIEYSIHVQNTGSAPINGYIITDTIPLHTTYVDGSSDSDGGIYNNGLIHFEGVDVGVGNTKVYRFRVKINGNLTGVDQISNVAYVKKDAEDAGIGTVPPLDFSNPTIPHPTANAGTATDIPVRKINKVSAWKAFKIENGLSTISVRGGEDLIYTVFVKNTGNQNIIGWRVTDVVPTGTVFKSASNGGIHENRIVSFSDLDVPVGNTISVSFVVKVNKDLSGLDKIENVAYVKSHTTDPGTATAPADLTNPQDGPDPSAQPGDPTITDVHSVFDLELWKSYRIKKVGSNIFDASLQAVSGGEVVEYTIHVKNTGNKVLTNIEIVDPLMPKIVLEPGYQSSAIIPLLNVGETKVHSFRVMVGSNLTGVSEIKNIATALSNEILTAEKSHPAIDNSTPTLPDKTKIGTIISITPLHDVSIILNGLSSGSNSGMAKKDDVITYKILITNQGNKDLSGLTVRGIIPGNTEYVTGSSVGVLNNDVIVFSAFDLSVGASKTFTYDVKVLAVAPPVPISNTAVVNYSGPSDEPLSKSALHLMPTDCTSVSISDLVLSVSSSVCLGSKVILSSSLSSDSQLPESMLSNLVWYRFYDPQTQILSGQLGIGKTIEVVPSDLNSTYYAVIVSPSYCYQGLPAEVNVVMNAVPSVPVIASLATNVFCDGDVVRLSVNNQVGGVVYSWFKDGLPLGTGVFYDVVESGIYAVQASLGTCASGLSDGVNLSFKPRPIANDISVTGNMGAICEGERVLLQVALNSSTSTALVNPVFHWYADAQLIKKVHTGASLSINPSASVTYYVTVSGDNTCENDVGKAQEISINVNPQPSYTVQGELAYGVEVGQSVTLPVVTSVSGLVTWFDDDGNTVSGGVTRVFNVKGSYTYTALVSEAGHCPVSISVVIRVFDKGNCPPVFKPIFATDATAFGVSQLLVPLGTVLNRSNAVDGKLETFSSIREGVNLLGGILTGQTYQVLKWTNIVEAGTAVTVKLGKSLNTVSAIGTLRLVAVDVNGNAVSTVQNVEPKLVDVLSGGMNVFQYTFTPVSASGQPVAYAGVKVYFAGVASVSQTVHVYEAYYHQLGMVDCTKGEVLDILYGVENPINQVSVGNALVGVVNAINAVDNVSTTFAEMNNLLGVNVRTRLEILYNTPSLVGDQVVLKLSSPSDLLTIQALQSLSIQPYLGNVPVGPPVTSGQSILNVDILLNSNEAQVTFVADREFDRIKILYGGVSGVLSKLHISEIKRTIPKPVFGPNEDNKFKICLGDDIGLDIPNTCTVYKLYDKLNGGNEVNVRALGAGIHVIYVQTIRYGACEVGERIPIEVEISAALPIPVIQDKILCQTATSLSIGYDATASAGSNLVYYSSATATVSMSSPPSVNSMVPGVYTVYVSQRSAIGCESVRVPVRITITRTAVLADIRVNNVTICEGESIVLSASSTSVSNAVFKYYTDPALTEELTSPIVSPTSSTNYYVTVSGTGVCTSPKDQAALIVVTVNKTLAPTISNASPTYCRTDKKTLADLPVMGTNVKWYNAPIGGTLLPSTSLLVSGVTYYASQQSLSCESVARLAVTPIISNCKAVFSIKKVSDMDRAVAGMAISFTLTLKNEGPAIAEVGDKISIEDFPSAGLEITSFTTNNHYGYIEYVDRKAVVTLNNNIPINGTVVVSVTGLVSADAPSSIKNKVHVWGPSTPVTDTPDGTSETDPIPVVRNYDMDIVKVADQASVMAGANMTFTVTVTNRGPSTIDIGKQIRLLERPGPGVSVNEYIVTSNNATIVATDNEAILTTTAKVVSGQSITVKVTAIIDDDAPAFITNGISVWSPDKPVTEDPDDKDDTPDIPVNYPLIRAIDDFVDVKVGSEVLIKVLENDIVTKWEIDPTTVEIIKMPLYGRVHLTSKGEVLFIAPRDVLGNIQFTYTVADIKGRISNEAVVSVNVQEALDIPDVITPNGDGANDAFVIRGLELYDSVYLTILNRWGNEVYSSRSYKNEWTGKGLNEGTYYYVVELVKNGTVIKHKGTVLIKRN